jgi:hypothetical protein
MHDRASGHRGLPPAIGAFIGKGFGLQQPSTAPAATRADKPFWPTALEEVLRTRAFRGEAALKLEPDSPAANYAFDVTPARLVTALIAERGICPASREGLLELFPECGGGGSLENSAGEKGSGWTTQPSGTERRLEIF